MSVTKRYKTPAALDRAQAAGVHLTRRERDCLAYLAAHAGRYVGSDELGDAVFGPYRSDAAVRVAIGRLRGKLGATAIEGAQGFGYRLAESRAAALWRRCERCGRPAVDYGPEWVCFACEGEDPDEELDGHTVRLECATCGREFRRDAGQLRRELRRRPYARPYCSPPCAQGAVRTRRQALMDALFYSEPGFRIYHGDARELVPAIVGSHAVQHVITDPPYDAATHAGAQGAGGKRPAGELVDFAPITAVEIADVLSRAAPRRWVVATVDYRHIQPLQDRPPLGLRFVRFGVWVKPDGAPQFTGDRPAQGWEAVAILHAEGNALRWNSGGDRAVWTVPRARPANHPTEKPIALVRQWIAQFTDVGDLILDPFMGSGTVLRAAKDLGRQAIGIEIDRRWCEHAAGRLAQSVMPGFDAPAAATEGERELAPGAGGVPPELFPVLEGARS